MLRITVSYFYCLGKIGVSSENSFKFELHPTTLFKLRHGTFQLISRNNGIDTLKSHQMRLLKCNQIITQFLGQFKRFDGHFSLKKYWVPPKICTTSDMIDIACICLKEW